MNDNILDIALKKGLAKEGVSLIEARELAALPLTAIYDIMAVTEKIVRHHKGTEVNICSIVNAKSGLCKEDCSFCSQSVKYSTDVTAYPMAATDAILDAARSAAAGGAREFSIVTSGTRVEKESDVAALVETLKTMKDQIALERCASLGIVSREVLLRLKDAGLESYHHNLETSRSFFPRICTTHAYDDDVEAVRAAKALGLHVCCGGVFGLGEAWEDRIELASTLRELDVDSIPINFLNPRPGTPLEGACHLTPLVCLKIIALMRLMLPAKDIVICGGRNVNLRDLQPLIFAAGANGMMTGNYLTTPGRAVADDMQMLVDLGLSPRGL